MSFNLDSYEQQLQMKARIGRLEKTVTDFCHKKGIKQFKLSGQQNIIEKELDRAGVKQAPRVE